LVIRGLAIKKFWSREIFKKKYRGQKSYSQKTLILKYSAKRNVVKVNQLLDISIKILDDIVIIKPMVAKMISSSSYPVTCSIRQFCALTSLGETLVREMVADGRLQSVRIGKKKILIVMQSYFDLIAKQQAEGTPDSLVTEKAVATRKQLLAARREAEADNILASAGL
jgi:hypothetical protein